MSRLNRDSREIDDVMPSAPAPAAEPAPREAEEDTVGKLAKALAAASSDAPSKSMLEAWKAQYGNLFIFEADAKRFFVMRPVTRPEYKIALSKIASESAAAQEAFMEDIVQTALLYPRLSPMKAASFEAGLLPTLREIIMKGSMFMSVEEALNRTIRI